MARDPNDRAKRICASIMGLQPRAQFVLKIFQSGRLEQYLTGLSGGGPIDEDARALFAGAESGQCAAMVSEWIRLSDGGEEGERLFRELVTRGYAVFYDLQVKHLKAIRAQKEAAAAVRAETKDTKEALDKHQERSLFAKLRHKLVSGSKMMDELDLLNQADSLEAAQKKYAVVKEDLERLGPVYDTHKGKVQVEGTFDVNLGTNIAAAMVHGGFYELGIYLPKGGGGHSLGFWKGDYQVEFLDPNTGLWRLDNLDALRRFLPLYFGRHDPTPASAGSDRAEGLYARYFGGKWKLQHIVVLPRNATTKVLDAGQRRVLKHKIEEFKVRREEEDVEWNEPAPPPRREEGGLPVLAPSVRRDLDARMRSFEHRRREEDDEWNT